MSILKRCARVDFEVQRHRASVSVRVAVTLRLWRLLVKSCVSLNGQPVEVEKCDPIQAASRALDQAMRRGLQAANFYVELATASELLAEQQPLRIEYQESKDATGFAVIGFPEDFATL